MAKKFQELIHGDLKRVVINIAPRHGKSELTSYLFLAWLMGQKTGLQDHSGYAHGRVSPAVWPKSPKPDGFGGIQADFP
jgi:hypothetical protein